MLMARYHNFLFAVYSCMQTVHTFYCYDRNTYFTFQNYPIMQLVEPKGFNFTFLGTVSWRRVKIHLKLNEPFYAINDTGQVSGEFVRTLLPNFTYMWYFEDHTWKLHINDKLFFNIEAERGDGSKSCNLNNSVLIRPR